jgi:flavin-dependent dehydrogenase
MKEKIQEANFYPVTKLLLSSPREYVLEATLNKGVTGADSYVVPRKEFDALIQQHAIDEGADFKQARVKSTIIEDGKVVGVQARLNGKDEQIRAKVVVGADGVTSVVARELRPDKHLDGHKAIALRAYVTDIEEFPNQVEFYLYKGILPGYAWIFPNGEGTANLGLGMRLDKFRDQEKDLEDMVDIFLEMPAIKKRLKRGGELNDTAVWQLNFGSQNMKRAYDGAVLVGDAAGLINPLTGGGIHNGLQSAKLAADAIHQAFLSNDFSYNSFEAYDSGIYEQMRGNMRKSYLIQRSLLHFPTWVDLLIRLGGSNGTVAQIFVDKL